LQYQLALWAATQSAWVTQPMARQVKVPWSQNWPAWQVSGQVPPQPSGPPHSPAQPAATSHAQVEVTGSQNQLAPWTAVHSAWVVQSSVSQTRVAWSQYWPAWQLSGQVPPQPSGPPHLPTHPATALHSQVKVSGSQYQLAPWAAMHSAWLAQPTPSQRWLVGLQVWPAGQSLVQVPPHPSGPAHLPAQAGVQIVAHPVASTLQPFWQVSLSSESSPQLSTQYTFPRAQ